MKIKYYLALAACLSASSLDASLLFGVTDTNDLVSFDSSTPSSFITSVSITGTSDDITDLAYDFSSGQLYGVDFSANVYSISNSGVATVINNTFSPFGFGLGLAYDPIDNTLTGTSDAEEFFTINPTNGTVAFGSDTVFEFGDVNEIEAAQFGAFAIDPDLGSSFAIDANLGVLASGSFFAQNEFFTVGDLGLSVFGDLSLTVTSDGELFATFDSQTGPGTSLYAIDDFTGAATEVGGTQSVLISITAVPEPSSATMVGLAGLLLLGRRRRK